MRYQSQVDILVAGEKNLTNYERGANLDVIVNQACWKLLLSMAEDMKTACQTMQTVPEEERRSAEWARFVHDAFIDATQDLHPFQSINCDSDEKLVGELEDICKTLEKIEGGEPRSVPEKFTLATKFCKHLAEELTAVG